MMTLNHGFSGYICGRVAMPLLARRAPVPPALMGWTFFLGAMVPDLDILARVLLGRGAYFSHAWFGHRQASHSVLGALVLGTLLALLVWALTRRRLSLSGTALVWLAGCGWAAGLIHIVGDLFTPGLPMPVLWPLDWRVGALRHIGWFTPYLFLMFLAALGVDAALAGARNRRWLPRPAYAVASWALYAGVAARWLHYLAVSRYESSAQYAAYQRTLLPDALIDPLSQTVRFLWFTLTR